MKFTLPIFALILLLTGCSNTPSDAELRQKVQGTWMPYHDSRKTTEHKADGSFVFKFTLELTNEMTAEGTWQIKDGFMVTTITNASWPDAKLEVNRYKIVHIDDHEMILRHDGATNLLKVLKK